MSDRITRDAGSTPSASPDRRRARRAISLSDDELMELWRLFRRAVGSVDISLNAALDDDPSSDCSRLTGEALMHLAAAPDERMPTGRLADAIGQSSGAVTKLVDRLVDLGYVERQYDRQDRRIVLCALTDAGRRAAQAERPVYVDQLRQQFETLGERRVSELAAACETILSITTSGSTPRSSGPRAAT